MYNNRRIVVLALMIAVSAAIEIQDAGSFPVGTDYHKEKLAQGQDPANYKKTYHKEIPGGSEHAEVVASNGPGSNSFSQTYSKHQSFGSSDTSQSRSFSSINNPSAISSETAKKMDEADSMAESIRKNIAKAQKDAMDRHNALMSRMQQNMAGMRMGMGMGSPFGSSEPKMYSDGSDDWMQNHIQMMNEMMRMQNEQIQALQQLIASSSYPRRSSHHSAIQPTQVHYQVPKTVDGEASVSKDSRKHHTDE
ncbi:hypothetical protein L3Y34_008693 [Caenorhabditis briggsae]|uniref:Uncharacterized protein n=1 Tax=Caenorhabditis briggsae TaxID=6238 RepID=A0AAE9D214_CAEBR|nr:hypothetical protein L3Y34_008693 [Caenorhabditis briggsae]